MIVTNRLKNNVISSTIGDMLGNLNFITRPSGVTNSEYSRYVNRNNTYRHSHAHQLENKTKVKPVDAQGAPADKGTEPKVTVNSTIIEKLDSLIDVSKQGFSSLSQQLSTMINLQSKVPVNREGDANPPSLEKMDVLNAVMGEHNRGGVDNLHTTLTKASTNDNASSGTNLMEDAGLIEAALELKKIIGGITASLAGVEALFAKLAGKIPGLGPKLPEPPPEEPTPPAEDALPKPPPEEPSVPANDAAPSVSPAESSTGGAELATEAGTGATEGISDTALSSVEILGGEVLGESLLGPAGAVAIAGTGALMLYNQATKPSTPEQKRMSVINNELRHLIAEKNNLKESIGSLVHSGGNTQEIYRYEEQYSDVVSRIEKLESQRKALKPIVNEQINHQLHSSPMYKGRIGVPINENNAPNLTGMPPSVVKNAHEAQDNLEFYAGVKYNDLPFKAEATNDKYIQQHIHHHEAPVYNNTTVNQNGGVKVNQPTTYSTPADKPFKKY